MLIPSGVFLLDDPAGLEFSLFQYGYWIEDSSSGSSNPHRALSVLGVG